MRHTKPPKPPASERNRVAWIEKNLKFIREHSVAYPKPAWSTTHVNWLIIGMILFFAMLIPTIFVRYIPLKIIFISVSALLLILYFIDFFIAGIRTSKFYKDLLERGGETADQWNAVIIRRSGTTANVIILFAMIFLLVYIVFLMLATIEGSRINPSSMIWSVNIVNLFNLYNFSHNSSYNYSPYIFMDINEGMFFGGAVFSYDTLCGIRPAGKGNGFELYYEGEKVAEGNMLSDDMKLLREIIDVRSKYSD